MAHIFLQNLELRFLTLGGSRISLEGIDGLHPWKSWSFTHQPQEAPSFPHQSWEIPHKEPLDRDGAKLFSQPAPRPPPRDLCLDPGSLTLPCPGQSRGQSGGWDGGAARPGAWLGQRREVLGSPGLYLLALRDEAYAHLQQSYILLWMETALAQKVKAVKATQNSQHHIQARGPPRPAPAAPCPRSPGAAAPW